MDTLVFISVFMIALAIFGALAALLGADSREPIEDTHQGQYARASL